MWSSDELGSVLSEVEVLEREFRGSADLHGGWSDLRPCQSTPLMAWCVYVGFQEGGVVLVATTKENIAPLLVIELLKRIIVLIKVIKVMLISP